MKNKIKILSVSLLLTAFALTGCGEDSIPAKPSTGKTNVKDVSLLVKSYVFEEIGDSFILDPTITYKSGAEQTYKSLRWFNSNSKAVSVIESPGSTSISVVAKSVGKSTVTVLVDSRYNAYCDFTVKQTGVDVDFRIDSSSIELKPGSSQTLSATADGVKIDSGVVWTVDDSSVATVDSNGVVTAVSEGTTKVKASYNQKTASCDVTVSNDAFEFSISPTSKTIEVGPKSGFQIQVTKNKDVEVAFESSNSAVATVDSQGNVVGIKKGNAVITVSAGGKTAECSVEVTEDSNKQLDVFFYLDYNNVDPKDTTGTKLIAHFKWYFDVPFIGAPELPKDPTKAADPAFPYFIGWSSHTIIDQAKDLWDMEHDSVEDAGEYSFNLYGIWSDVPKGGFIK